MTMMGPCLGKVLQHARMQVEQTAGRGKMSSEDVNRLATLSRYEQRFSQTVAALEHQASESVPTMDTPLPAMTDFVDEHLMTSSVPVICEEQKNLRAHLQAPP